MGQIHKGRGPFEALRPTQPARKVDPCIYESYNPLAYWKGDPNSEALQQWDIGRQKQVVILIRTSSSIRAGSGRGMRQQKNTALLSGWGLSLPEKALVGMRAICSASRLLPTQSS
jgi:hypothetical protein